MNRALLLLLLLCLPLCLHAQPFDYPSANLSTTWINSPDAPHMVSYPDGSTVKAVLLRQSTSFYGPTFACGFYCMNPCHRYLFAVYILYTNSGARITLPVNGIPQVVWSANRDRPISENATLQLTAAGELVLKDADGSLVWSTNTAGKAVVGMNLTQRGNLVLFDAKNTILWQSFDHPTDTLLSGQSLVEGQKLTANASASNWTHGQLYISYTPKGFQAFIDSNPPQVYFNSFVQTIDIRSRKYPCFLSVTDKALTFVSNSSSSSDPNATLANPPVSTVQFLRLESDGRMKLYEWGTESDGWYPTVDVIKPYLGDCAFPTVCGSYGICLSGQCGCPRAADSNTSFFRLVNDALPNLGCSLVAPLSCKSQEQHQFLALPDVSYFNFIDNSLRDYNSTTAERCKEVCLKNCTCKAALFQYGSNASDGSCYLPQEIFSLMNNMQQTSHYNSTAYIKIQLSPASAPPPPSNSNSTSTPLIVGATIGSVLGVLLIFGLTIMVYRKVHKIEEENYEEDDFPQLPGMPTRFSYEDLKIATENFARKLGSGGFGSVFAGTLADGTRIAVKQLESVRQGKREFLTEVETIGSIHHLNLVRLIGFCAERLHRLLVYEYMSNGSLDKWIFDKTEDDELSWEIRCRIIRDVAKGLLYLHEECRQRIAHLDIKPQNILLDSNFNAKVSDFGLAKLIDRDQSAVMTMMRGTPGYLAPEWLTSVITEKVDVYSFGVVIMEIVCGRRNLDHSRGEESMHLLSLLKEKATMGSLLDVIDRRCDGMQFKEKEMEKMLELAVWCLQNHTSKRPSMSMVVKVLDGALDIAKDIDYDFSTPVQKFEHKSVGTSGSTPLLASELSGPR